MVNGMKIAIIGHFGGEENFLDGQTVKTKILYQELLKHTNWRILKVDTYFKRTAPINFKRTAPIKLLGQLMLALLTTKDIIIITSQNGRRFFFPILFIASKILGLRVYHDVIGARLPRFALEYPAFKKYLNSFQVNWVETMSLKRQLENIGVLNCEVVPNFKRLSVISNQEICYHSAEPYKMCTFSRVMREKGIQDAVEAVKTVNAHLGRTVCTLDIYGQVDPAQLEWFEQLQKTFPEFVCYRGLVPFDKSVEVLKDYFALLFPTHFDTEGIPGTIVDAYAAGVPVIAAKWESFSDVVEDGVSGYGYTLGSQSELEEKLEFICQHPEQWNAMRSSCLEEAKKYRPEELIKIIIDRMDV